MGARTAIPASPKQLDAVAVAARAALLAMLDVLLVITERGLADEVMTDTLVARHRGKMATLQRALTVAGYLPDRKSTHA
jgi:hypothetical protein